ncbi:MAG: L-serine ammonia-lyase, iron-sulfur-dependent, subunit alpha [Acidobacteriota bacterium]|nr:L-serine ammonia-lyase, iron-sulfur-dependent, subunit alpha [Acidobacteriota bacterium]
MRVSRNIFKNTFAILIPNANGHKGIVMSAALGVLCDPRQGMGLFAAIDAEKIMRAEALMARGTVAVEIAHEAPSDLYIEVEVECVGHTGVSILRDEHSKIVCLRRDGKILFGSDGAEQDGGLSPELAALRELTVADLVAMVEDLPPETETLLRRTVEMNLAACHAGLSRPMGVAAGFWGTVDEDTNSFAQHLASLTAAGSDARMSGYPVEIMTSAGSGNQGIIATIPAVAYAQSHAVPEARMLRALALSHLVTMYMTGHIGYLSALCGVAIKAGVGASCGVVYAMGGGVEEVERAIKIMAASLTGMICDGAKVGCALKVSNASETAARSARLAMQKAEVPDDNGIVAPTAEQTIRNLAELGRSMEVVDQKIIQIMLNKIGGAR